MLSRKRSRFEIEQAEKFDRQCRYDKFEKKYRPLIEDGLTEKKFKKDYAVNAEEVDFFDKLATTIQAEQREMELFDKGFNGTGKICLSSK